MLDESVEEYLKVEYKYPRGTFWMMRSYLKCARILEGQGRMDRALGLYRKLAEGEVVVVDDHFGIRITQLVSPRERIKNLG